MLYWREGSQEKLIQSIGESLWNIFKMVQRVSGRLQEAPRSPPDPIKKYEFIRKFNMFHLFFLLPIELPIELSI